jgi:hypothetical protein
MEMMMLAAMIGGNPRRRNEMLQFFLRQRKRNLKKWRHVASILIALYYTWKGGSLVVKNGKGVEVEITDPSLTDSERIRALAEQSKLNSQDQRWAELLRQAMDLIFYWLDDDSDVQLMQADLWRSMDYADAPSADVVAQLEAAYAARMNGGGGGGSSGGGSSYGSNGLLNAPSVNRNTQMGTATNPINVDARRGGL